MLRCGTFLDLAQEPIVHRTGLLPLFRLMPYETGFVLEMPSLGAPDRVAAFEPQPHLFQVYQEHAAWGRILGVTTVGQLNEVVANKQIDDIVHTAEALHQKKLAAIAASISSRKPTVRLVLAAGPSSSGKTTFAMRLVSHLRVNGLRPVVISTDDYFVGDELNPRDAQGNLDYEHIESMDLPRLNRDLLDLLEMDLARMGLDTARASSVAEALRHLGAATFDLCLTDMRLPDGGGIEVVRHIALYAPRTPVAVVTAFGSAENAVTALKAGAYDYVEKPVTTEKIRGLVRSALKLADPEEPEQGRELVGDSPPMEQVRALIGKVARSQAPVFISGETGTGKEVAARLIHARSARAEAPFLAVNCGAIPETLMESEFFGYRKGAFTGADSERDGFFQAGAGGTLFLDEIVELPLSMQVKLLRAIQEKRVRRVGGILEEVVDVRLISASHQDLQAAVNQGRLRQDLFYRLNVIEIHMPALRERREDVAQLAHYLRARLCAGRDLPTLTAAAQAALAGYGYPGNVRELENILERALALCEGGRIEPGDLNLTPQASGPDGLARGLGLQDQLDAVERRSILEALQRSDNNKTAAARLLGVTFRSLRYRMERLGME